MKICISSGHSTKCQGADDIMNEVEEATALVDDIALGLADCGLAVEVFHDTVSTTQDENLNRIVDWHNSFARDLDVSVHFNAFQHTTAPMGVEVCYLSQETLADDLAANISDVSGLINRGGKYRDDLFVLNNCAAPTVLIEVCFLDSVRDVELYRTYYTLICEAIVDTLANAIGGVSPVPEPGGTMFFTTGRCSYFGGPDDMGVAPDEGLAFHYDINPDNEHLFLPTQPAGTTGLARRLNARAVHYVACRWSYDITSKDMLADSNNMALVINPATGMALTAWPADWGPHEEKTGRAADLSPALMRDLGLVTDDVVEVRYPWKGN